MLFVSLFVVAYYSIVHFTDCEDGVGKRRKLWRNEVANKVNHGKCSRRIIPFHLFHSLLAMQILLQRSNVPRLLSSFYCIHPVQFALPGVASEEGTLYVCVIPSKYPLLSHSLARFRFWGEHGCSLRLCYGMFRFSREHQQSAGINFSRWIVVVSIIFIVFLIVN